MSGLLPLRETDEQFHTNTILFKLADALGYSSEEEPTFDREGRETIRTIVADPDTVLEHALSAIAALKEVRKYANDRMHYGRMNRSVHSGRIGADLLRIVDHIQ